MRIRVYGLRPYFDIDGYFIDLDDKSTFDPKHPGTYPGAEVEQIETLSIEEALAKYGRDALCFSGDVLYSQNRATRAMAATVTIWRETGRTSRSVVYGSEEWER